MRSICLRLIVAVAVIGLLGFRAHGAPAADVAQLQVVNLRTEYKHDPVGIDSNPPRLSWQLQSATRGLRQAAYQIRVAATSRDVAKGVHLLFDSGKVISDESVLLPYAGPRMKSRQQYYWQVRAWDSRGRSSRWSAPAHWEAGLLSQSDWHAHWISAQSGDGSASQNPLPLLRREFQLDGNIAKARAYVTSRGLYELYLNGARVGDQLFTPGWTSFDNRLQYQTYDVTALLRTGRNAVGAMLGEGWYSWITFDGSTKMRTPIALSIQIEVTYDDGRTQRVVSDSDWKAIAGPILLSSIYNGETYDARLERAGWADAGYDDHDWRKVEIITPAPTALVAAAGPPVRRIEERRPERIFKTPAGLLVADMGQNMVGWVRLRVRGPVGTVVVLRHAEVLDAQGNFYTDNLRSAKQRIQYTLKGQGEEVFEPHFTFQGFRYVSIEGYPGELRPDGLTGIVIHSDMKRTGTFETSSELVNRLYSNIVWTQKGNFLDVPMDCPQRDERLGWAGDAQLFSATAALNMDVANFYTKWLGDLAVEQTAQGAVPWEVPRLIRSFPLKVLRKGSDRILDGTGAAVYGDAATVVPWNLYLAYGDLGILRSHYRSMERWVEFVGSRAGADHIWSEDFTFGDWLDVASLSNDIETKSNFGATSEDLISTAYYARSIDILRQSAQVLGRSNDEIRYAALLNKVREAFRRQFVSDDGRVGEGTQTAHVLALDFDLLPEALRHSAARRLAEDVQTRGHLMTGITGTPRLLNVLSRFGYVDEAYGLLNRKDFPSWLYPVTRGATTIWERWDGIKPDGSFADFRGNSFNHYVLGSVGEWMYRVMAGIDVDPQAPGYKHSFIRPIPGGGFTSVQASVETLYGRLSSQWKLEGRRFTLNIEVPPNTRSTVRLPHSQLAQVREGNRELMHVTGIANARQENNEVILEVGSGRYQFVYPWRGSAHTMDSFRSAP